MNPFISINGHLDEEAYEDYVCELADEHGVSSQVIEEYLRLEKLDPENLFGEHLKYLEKEKQYAQEMQELDFD